MLTFDDLDRLLQTCPVLWRWEGRSGHPRQLADVLGQVLEDRFYNVETAGNDIQAEALANVGEFQGKIVAKRQGSRWEAFRERWAYALIGLILLPLFVGIFLIIAAFAPRRYYIGLYWRGEVYTASGRVESASWGIERANVISDVRLTIRGIEGFGTPKPRPEPGHPNRPDRPEFREDISLLIQRAAIRLPELLPPSEVS